MTDLRALIYVEIDTKFCSLEYGVAPCTAEIGVTGEAKCYNTRNQKADCQDPANFTPTTKTLRFGLRDCGYLPSSIPCIPLLASASVNNAVVKPGESIGERAKLTASFYNGRHSDNGIDPYVAERGYIAFERGTFWGKFRARNTYLEARPIRIYRGYLGQTLEEMDCEHFVIDTMEGPGPDGRVTITGVDFMRLLNSEKAQAPAPNSGYLSADLATGASSFDVLPAGIGDLEYPASGTLVLGQEQLPFTRSGNTFTISGVTVEDHDEGEVVQIPLIYASENAADIVNDLIVNYSPLNSSHFDYAAALEIVTSFADVLYSRTIPKPTPVVELLNELIEQAGLVVFGNTRTQQVVFDVLRPNPATGLPIGPDEVLANSFRQMDQPKKRFSSVWVFYGKRNIFEGDEPTNYYSAVIYPAADNQYETESIKKIYSKWIPSPARSVATDVAARAIARYKFPPRALRFSLFARNTRDLGQVVELTDASIEDATGAQDTIQAIVTGWRAAVDRNDYEAEEYSIAADDFSGDKIIQFDYDTYNINLRDVYDSLYSTVDTSTDAPDIIFIINRDVVVGSTSAATYAIESGDWPAGVEPLLVISNGAFAVGLGGNGGYGGGPTGAGKDGGPALRVTSPIRIDSAGTIGGGGGGGGGSSTPTGGSNSGGGGAGRIAGTGMVYGSVTDGGVVVGGITGSGGDLGQPGTSGTDPTRSHGPGGAAGVAIRGVSMVTFVNTGTIRGFQIG